MPLPRSHAEILGAHRDVIEDGIKKVAVATVTAVHPERQTVDCQLAVENPLWDEIGNVVYEPTASISDVPLCCLRGGGALVWIPVDVGDSVLLIFSDLSCDVWRAGDGTPQSPGFVGKHTMDSPFALPCVAPDARMFVDPGSDPTKVIIGRDGSAAQIRISAAAIELGNAATDAVALASLVATELGKISTALGSLVVTATDAVTGAAVTGTAVASSPYVPGSVASTLIKAQ